MVIMVIIVMVMVIIVMVMVVIVMVMVMMIIWHNWDDESDAEGRKVDFMRTMQEINVAVDCDDANDREVMAKYFGSSLDCMTLNKPIDKCPAISPLWLSCNICIYIFVSCTQIKVRQNICAFDGKIFVIGTQFGE